MERNGKPCSLTLNQKVPGSKLGRAICQDIAVKSLASACRRGFVSERRTGRTPEDKGAVSRLPLHFICEGLLTRRIPRTFPQGCGTRNSRVFRSVGRLTEGWLGGHLED